MALFVTRRNTTCLVCVSVSDHNVTGGMKGQCNETVSMPMSDRYSRANVLPNPRTGLSVSHAGFPLTVLSYDDEV